jgi:hypothetical protein
MLINQDFSPDRTKYIGGSDIGAILGYRAIDPFGGMDGKDWQGSSATRFTAPDALALLLRSLWHLSIPALLALNSFTMNQSIFIQNIPL